MTPPSNPTEQPLSRHRGLATLSAPEVITKAVLECLPSVSVLSLTECPSLQSLIEQLKEPEVRDVLRMNRLRVITSPDATRAFERAAWAARSGRHVLAVLAGTTAASAIAAIRNSTVLANVPDAAIGCVIEDRHSLNGVDVPGTLLLRSELPVIAASTVDHLRDCVEHTLRLSRAEHVPAVTLVHPTTLESGSTITLRANRSDEDPEDVGLRHRHRGPRWNESGGALRMARRLELNSHLALPSPGDPSPVGFVTVGPMHQSLLHVLSTLGMIGRVPILHLGLIQPIDEAPVKRLLARCRKVVVLEPTPGTVESRVLACAERMRTAETDLATIWGKVLPPRDGQDDSVLLGDPLHPSVLARRILPLLQELNPRASASTRFELMPPELPVELDSADDVLGPGAMDREVRRFAHALFDSVTDDGTWLGSNQVEDDEQEDQAKQDPVRLYLNGIERGPGDGRQVNLETWSHTRFERFGSPAVRQALASKVQHLFLISQYPGDRMQDIERLARSMVPAGQASRVIIRRVNLGDPDRVLHIVREIALSSLHGLVILDDGPPARFGVDAVEVELKDIDQRGFQSMQRLIWPSDRACIIRQKAVPIEAESINARQAMPTETTWSIDPIKLRWPPRLGGRIRPLVEQIEVFRSQAPVRHTDISGSGIPAPTPRHGDRPMWSAHIAGLRGAAPGACMKLLINAGQHMGYRVRFRFNPEPIGAGRYAWGQLLYTRHDEAHVADGLSSNIPFGEADLLLGFDRSESLRSVGPDEHLRVASSDRTCGVVNIGLFEDQLDLGLASQDVQAIEAYMAFRLSEHGRFFASFTELCRYRFHNERMSDLVQLGTAFQLGLIPATVDAMTAAAKSLEPIGYARSLEAFEFGRRLAIDPDLNRRQAEDHVGEPPGRIVRRFGHALRKTGPGRLARAARFRHLVQRTLDTMPGLEETRLGRESRRDLVIAMRRCMIWRSFEDAERIAFDITALYQADRGERGRQLTRLAILPLAESTLIRDAIYMASMAVSPEHRRRTRHRLNVKRGRGDRIESRYLTRIELVLVKWRFRVDLRTSDWATRLLASLRRFIPRRWRGTGRERAIRTAVRDIVHRATMEQDRYEHWASVLGELHAMALDGRLRRSSAATLDDLARYGPHASEGVQDDASAVS